MSAMTSNDLFAAAREDGPAAEERDAVFRRVALVTGIAAAGAVAASASAASAASASSAAASLSAAPAAPVVGTAAAAGTSFGMKLLALGAVLGAASTALGVILALTMVTPEGPRAGRAHGGPVPAAIAPGARLAQPTARKRDMNQVAAAAAAAAKASADADASRANGGEATSNANSGSTGAGAGAGLSDLGEEARLVTAARAALVAGDPARALTLVQGTRKLSARSLEPEELGLEARALHALGRTDDAAATELVLKRRYPDHALAH